MSEIARTFGIIFEEDILRCKFLESAKKDQEEVAEHSLKQDGYKLLKKEWKREMFSNNHLYLKITYMKN